MRSWETSLFSWPLQVCMCWNWKQYYKVPSFSYRRQKWGYPTELDRENLDFPFLPYLTSHGQKIGSNCILLIATPSEVDDCICATLQVWSAQCGHNISALEDAQSYSVSICTLFGKDPNQPNFSFIADGVILHNLYFSCFVFMSFALFMVSLSMFICSL